MLSQSLVFYVFYITFVLYYTHIRKKGLVDNRGNLQPYHPPANILSHIQLQQNISKIGADANIRINEPKLQSQLYCSKIIGHSKPQPLTVIQNDYIK